MVIVSCFILYCFSLALLIVSAYLSANSSIVNLAIFSYVKKMSTRIRLTVVFIRRGYCYRNFTSFIAGHLSHNNIISSLFVSKIPSSKMSFAIMALARYKDGHDFFL